MKTVLVLAASTLLALVGAELFLRQFRPVDYRQPEAAFEAPDWTEMKMVHRPSRIRGLAYELVPNVDTETRGMVIRTNSYGMRGPEPAAEKDSTLVRVAILGDSVTFGVGVDGEVTYPAFLERLLNESSPEGPIHYEVLNFGVSGYSTRDEAVVFRRKALDFDPDVVVIGYVPNDPEIDPVQPLHQHFHTPKWWEHSHLARLIAKANEQREAQGFTERGDYIRTLHSHPRKWGSVLSAFDDIAGAAADRGIEVILLIFPQIQWEDSWNGYPYEDVHEQVAAAGRERGFHVIPLLPAFRNFPPKELRVSKGNGHPNDVGHYLVATELAARILGDREQLR